MSKPISHEQVTATLRKAYLELFTEKSYDAKRDAQVNLAGRSHYVDDASLRFFHARIVYAQPIFGGAFYLLIEKSALDYDNKTRGFFPVLFDVFGRVVYKPELNQSSKTKDKAKALFWVWFEALDVSVYYRETLNERANRLQNESVLLARAAFELCDSENVEAI